ncbi:MAG: ThuA domain-containing protein [Firmicutes bacterium]|nr:ThuA domain-containing protein [Bacillota bacterium]
MREPVRVLIFLSGGWHDFNGFAGAMRSLLTPHDFAVDISFDPDSLLRLAEMDYRVVINYTCFLRPDEETSVTGAENLEESHVTALSGWVRNGGGLLAAHAATVNGDSPAELNRLLGGTFLSHPEPFAFTVYPLLEKHPITGGLKAFTVYDEFYIEEYDPSVRLHMVAVDRGTAYPVVWSKTENKGKVVHVALGHDENVWNHPAYRRLMLQSVSWLAGRDM